MASHNMILFLKMFAGCFMLSLDLILNFLEWLYSVYFFYLK